MSDTPRTDKAAYWLELCEVVAVEFFRELERENAALREDKERLDWLEANSGSIYRRTQPYRACIADETSIRLGHFRAAIDAARKEQP